jgi:hypothetical protein
VIYGRDIYYGIFGTGTTLCYTSEIVLRGTVCSERTRDKNVVMIKSELIKVMCKSRMTAMCERSSNIKPYVVHVI